MEADWEVELGGDAPVIDADWPGRIDLRRFPEAASALPETTGFRELAPVLVRLNAAGSGLGTSKCDVWDVDEFDRDELAAPRDEHCALACYVDLVPEDLCCWTVLEAVTAWARQICSHLRGVELRSCRADLVVRQAMRPKGKDTARAHLGITVYGTGCGTTRQTARAALAAAMATLADCILAEGPPEA